MIVNKKDVDIISVELDHCILIIKYPEVNYAYWKGFKPYEDDEDITIILRDLLVYLDCTVMFSNSRLLYTNQMMYEKYISDYYYYLIHFDNQILYNTYFDLLLQRHQDNVDYEFDNPIVEHITTAKAKSVAKSRTSNKFIRQVTTDLFTNKETYTYINKQTNEIIKSDNPNMLDELNAKPKKEKKAKSAGVQIADMKFVFNFKKKEK